MNLTETASMIDAAIDLLRRHNDRMDKIDYWRSEVARLKAVADTKQSGTVDMHVANVRICDAEFALFQLTGNVR